MYRIARFTFDMEHLAGNQSPGRLVPFFATDGTPEATYCFAYREALSLPPQAELIYTAREMAVFRLEEGYLFVFLSEGMPYAMTQECGPGEYRVTLPQDSLEVELHPYVIPNLLMLERPLLRRDCLVLLGKGPRDELVRLNGRGFAQLFSQIVQHPWGADYMERALSLAQALCGQKGMFTRVSRVIDLLLASGIRVELKTMLNPLNEHDAQAMHDFAQARGVYYEAAAYAFPPTRKAERAEAFRFTPAQAVRCTHPFEQGFLAAWEALKAACDRIRMSPACSSCDRRQICTVCPAANLAETGRYDCASPFHCEMTALTLEQIRQLAAKRTIVEGEQNPS